jgi:hypothetical protein
MPVGPLQISNGRGVAVANEEAVDLSPSLLLGSVVVAYLEAVVDVRHALRE